MWTNFHYLGNYEIHNQVFPIQNKQLLLGNEW
jgi:hypothetical protein